MSLWNGGHKKMGCHGLELDLIVKFGGEVSRDAVR